MTASTREVWEVLLSNELFLNKMELAYAKRLVKWTQSGDTPFDHIGYLNFVQSLGLAKQKQEVNFLVKIFEEAGIHLSFFELRFYQNGRSEPIIPRVKLVTKACLASNEQIQALVIKKFQFSFCL